MITFDDPADLATLASALSDAVAYRLPDSDGCRDCTRLQRIVADGALLCDDHAMDAARAAAYAELAQRKGIEVEQ